jgi:hypothetical protein
MKESGVPAALSGQHFDCGEREWRQAHTNDVMAGELAERQADGMICGKFVIPMIPISSYEDRSRSLNTPADESQEVECRRVSPMEILQNNHANVLGSCQFLEEKPKQPVTRFVIACAPPTERQCLRGNLVHWRECPGRGEPVARAPECARVAPMLRHKSLHQRTLAETRFAGDEEELTGSRACLPEAPVEFFELLLTLEQVHDRCIIGPMEPVRTLTAAFGGVRLSVTFASGAQS